MAEIGASGGFVPPPGSSAAASMQRQVDNLQAQVVQLRKLQSSGRWWLFWTTLIVVVLVAAFTFFTYWKIRENFNQDAVREAINANGTDVLPIATQMLMQTGRDAMPAYQTALVAGLRDRGPGMAETAYKRLQDVPEQDGKMMQDKLQAAFDAAVKQTEPQFKAAFPNLSDDKRQQMINDFATAQIDKQNTAVAAQIKKLYTNDLIQLQAVMEKFDLPSNSSPEKNPELEKEFLHTMVALLDSQIDAAYAAPAADESGGNGRAAATQPVGRATPGSDQQASSR